MEFLTFNFLFSHDKQWVKNWLWQLIFGSFLVYFITFNVMQLLFKDDAG